MWKHELLGEPHTVPANASRYFPTRDHARRQPIGRLQLAWNPDDPYLVNHSYDPTLIVHDASYCTTVADINGVPQVPTLDYIDRVLPSTSAHVVDIGCGRGEFVQALRARGVDAVGYDPVLSADTAYLRGRYWEPGDEPAADLFVMRCVLPHIPDPWGWLASMGSRHPGAVALIEYQRIGWAAERGIWYQLSHDHVNMFRARDFQERFDVTATGRFGLGEWEWVLIRPDSYRAPEPSACDVGPVIEALEQARAITLKRLEGRDVVLWGAAGKGIVLAHSLIEAGATVRFAVDADSSRWGRFMEASGVAVLSPTDAMSRLGGSELIVCNPSHEAGVRDMIRRARSSKA